MNKDELLALGLNPDEVLLHQRKVESQNEGKSTIPINT